MRRGAHANGALLAAGLLVLAIWVPQAVRAEVSTPSSDEPDTLLGTLEQCRRYAGVPDGWAKQAHAGMVSIPGGEFEPGSINGYPEERPAGKVAVEPFWMDRTEVTNAQFARFVEATGYVTETERMGGAAVFRQPASGAGQGEMDWWHYVEGASWRHPEGPSSDLAGRRNEPVTLVTYRDALAYARWLGRDLPTEAEWEWAARGNGKGEQLDREPRDTHGKALANYWQGIFPIVNSGDDGFSGRSPVGCFPANGYGLHDMIGNVWEWTQDTYTGHGQGQANGDPSRAYEQGRAGTPGQKIKTIKGGSFLCSSDYCARYRSAARHPQEADLGTTHVGFRTVLRLP